MNLESAAAQEDLAEDTNVDVMAARPLHRIMVTLNKPARWSNLGSALSILFLAALPALFWWLLPADFPLALFIGAALLLFFMSDLLILAALPRLRISFGAWQPQLFQLALLRSLLAIAVTAVAFAAGVSWGGVVFLALQVAGTVALFWGAVVEPSRLQMTRLAIASDRLAPGVRPIRLLHISDLHIEYLSRREDDLLRFAALEQPDLIVISGDYVNLSYNRDRRAYRRIHDYLAQLSAPYGVYASLGTPTVDLRESVVPMFSDLPVILLRGESRRITLGSEGQRITLLGLDCTHHIAPDAAVLRRVAEQAGDGAPLLLLYHSPELMPQAAEVGIDLYLCGHTHGGQVRLPLIGPLLTSSQLGRRYVMGCYQIGRTHLYISRGVGLEGLSAPRVRFLAPPEITLVTIKPA